MNLRDFDDHPPSPSHSHSLSQFSLSHRNSTGSFTQIDDSKGSLLQTATRSRSTPSLSELRLEAERANSHSYPVVPTVNNVNRSVLLGLGLMTGMDDSANGVEVRVMDKDRLATAPKMIEFQEGECLCKKHPHIASHSASSSSSAASDDPLSCSSPTRRVASCPACSSSEGSESIPFPPTVSLSSFRASSESSFRSGPSPILPDCLYLGGNSDASNLHVLLERNIGVVINVTAEVPNYFPKKLVYYKYFFVDLPTQSISHVFDEVSGIIDDYIYTHKKAVLIHCFAGVSRSASFVIAYLMKSLGMSYDNAFQFVKERRKIICPNDGFRKQLQEYEQKLKNEKEGGSSSNAQFMMSPISPKKIQLPVISYSHTAKDKKNAADSGDAVDSMNGLANALGAGTFFNFPASSAPVDPSAVDAHADRADASA